MRFLLLLVGLLTSCAPYMDLDHGIVSGGMLSSTQGFSGTMTSKGGVKATWSMTGVDAATGASNIAGDVVGYGALKYGFKTQDSNNHLSAAQGHQSVQNNALAHPVTNTTQSIDPTTGTVLTNSSQSFAPVFGKSHP